MDIAPTTAAAGSNATYVLTLRNSTASTHTLGSANVAVPTGSGFTVTAVAQAGAPAGKTWSAEQVSGVIQLRASTSQSALAPGQSVSTTLTVSTSCTATTATWTSQAKQANSFNGPPGNDFVRQGSDPALVVTGGDGTLASLEFVQQPTDAEKGSPITPAVTVHAVDACGGTATGATGNVSIALGSNPSAGTLGGTLSQPLVSGVATFGDLTVDKSGVGYTLAATKGALSATSDPFDVADALCTSADAFCEAEDAAGKTHVKTDGPPSGGTMALTFMGSGGTFSCGGATLNTVGSQVKIDPKGYTAPIQATFTWDKEDAPGTGVANFVFCLSKDGGATYITVPNCNKKNPNPNPACELRRSRTGVGDLEIVALLHPTDPIGGIGKS